MMGIFPNAGKWIHSASSCILIPLTGQDVYFITPPFFASVSITNPQTGKTATIRNTNFDGGVSNIYVQTATLDGKPYARNWLQHKFFLKRGILELKLGPMESDWGTREEDIPPSIVLRGESAERLWK